MLLCQLGARFIFNPKLYNCTQFFLNYINISVPHVNNFVLSIFVSLLPSDVNRFNSLSAPGKAYLFCVVAVKALVILVIC